MSFALAYLHLAGRNFNPNCDTEEQAARLSQFQSKPAKAGNAAPVAKAGKRTAEATVLSSALAVWATRFLLPDRRGSGGLVEFPNDANHPSFSPLGFDLGRSGAVQGAGSIAVQVLWDAAAG